MQNKYKDISFGTAEAVFNKLGGKEGVEKFLRDETKVVENETTEFPEFMTIELGTHKSFDAIRKDLVDNGIHFRGCVNDMLGKTKLTKSKTEVVLHTATVKELTGKNFATYNEITEAIRSKGYQPCPAEVGPQIRLQYFGEPYGSWIIVAMDPITSSDDEPLIFGVSYQLGDRLLIGVNIDKPHGSKVDGWEGDCLFVFVSK